MDKKIIFIIVLLGLTGISTQSVALGVTYCKCIYYTPKGKGRQDFCAGSVKGANSAEEKVACKNLCDVEVNKVLKDATITETITYSTCAGYKANSNGRCHCNG